MKHPNLTYFQIAMLFIGTYIVSFFVIVFTLHPLVASGLEFVADIINISTYIIMLYALFLLVRKLKSRKLTA
jgi:hypothetical protein